jgi:hypothetical protein
VERTIKSADSQISQTKERFELPNASGIVLISNESNTLHNNPLAYREILGLIFRKRNADGELRYTQIDGGVYFSKSLPARHGNMPFWAPFHVPRPTNADAANVQTFLLQLRAGWYEYIEKTTGATVRQHNLG